MKTITNRVVAVAAGVALAVGVGVATAAPANAATAAVTLSKWEAYHQPSSQVPRIRHFDIASGKQITAGWAARGATSRQASCWAGVTSRGAQAG